MSKSKPGKPGVLLRKMQFPTEYGLFVVVNLLDLFITMLFIRVGAREANPAAEWILLSFGKPGFVVYKIVLMLVVIGLCEVVARKRKTMARALIWFGIVAVTFVAVTSAMRYYNYMQDPTRGRPPAAAMPARPTPGRTTPPTPSPTPPGPAPPAPVPPPPNGPPNPQRPGGQ